MSHQIKKLLVLTSGGDAPGMNAALRAVLRSAIYHGIEVYGSENGYQGLVDQTVFQMLSRDAANTIQRGGTFLKSARCKPFMEKSVRDECRKYLDSLEINAMVILGGDGSFRGAWVLENEGGPKTVGIPCTIDNDIVGTEYTIGFDTACNTALQAIDKIRDTAFSHNRHFLVEVMGRAAGFLAVDVGIAGGAEFILIPEKPLPVEDMVLEIKNRIREKLASIVVVAEGGNAGWSVELAKRIKELSGITYRVCILGHIQRGGSPTVKDRKIASLMGYHAIELLVQGESKKMVAVRNNDLVAIDFPDPSCGSRSFNQDELLKINRIICGV